MLVRLGGGEEARLYSQTQTPAAISTLPFFIFWLFGSLFPVGHHACSQTFTLLTFPLEKKKKSKITTPPCSSILLIFSTPKTLQAQTCACFAGTHLWPYFCHSVRIICSEGWGESASVSRKRRNTVRTAQCSLEFSRDYFRTKENLTACTLGEGQARQKWSGAMTEVFSPR